MELTGEHRIPAPRKTVWDALHDPEILKECIKGCQSMEMVGDDKLTAKVQAKVGPVKATFDADVAIVDAVEPERYTLVGEGKGGVAGFAKGSADVNLAEDGEDTILTYHAKAQIGGKLAQLGSRLVDTTAKKYAADFFEKFSEKVGGAPVLNEPREDTAPPPPPEPGADVAGRVEPTAAAAPSASSDMAPTQAPDVSGGESKGAFASPWVWGILAFAVVLVVLLATQ